MKVLLTKNQYGCLAPGDSEATEVLSGIAQGEIVSCEIRRPRNIKFHRMFFALLGKAHENLPEDLASLYPTVERFLMAIKCELGYFDMLQTPSGMLYPITRSINFASMDEDEFHKFYREVLRYLCEILDVSEIELQEAASGKFG